MIDDDFMLAPVVARYLLDTPEGRSRAKEFLNRTMHERNLSSGGETYQDVLLRNFHFVLDRAAPFVERPDVEHLIALYLGNTVGEWRDSEQGLGGGTIPYNVNAALVPAALQAIGRLAKSGLLDVEGGEAARLAEAAWMAEVWTKAAPPFFTVTVEPNKAEDAVRAYAKRARVDPPEDVLRSLPQEPLRFNAVSLHADGERVPVLNSDAGFALLFLEPPEEEVERSVKAMMRPFPAGLRTDVGLLVANPAFADYSLQPKFDNRKYHGTVIWSWQQAVLAAGLARQLERKDLSPGTTDLLRAARACLWQTIDKAGSKQGDKADDKAGRRSSELWSWSFKDGQYRVEPFGQRAGDETESNAAQLWSTVFLALDSKGIERGCEALSRALGLDVQEGQVRE
jgi:hypothetical protein